MAASALSPTRPRLAALCIAVLAVLLAPAHARAATLYVSSGTAADPASCGAQASPCATIDQALTHASPGDTVQVAAGTYPAARVGIPVHLRGMHAGSPGPVRGFGAGPTTQVMGTLTMSAGGTVDGIDFIGSAPAVLVDAPSGSVTISNVTIDSSGAGAAIQVDAGLSSFVVRDSLLRGGSGASGIRVDGRTFGGIPGVVVERTTFRGFGAAAIDAAGVPGMQVRDNAAQSIGTFVRIADTVGAAIDGNRSSGHTGPAIHVGAGVTGLAIARNVLDSGSAAALLLDATIGTGVTSDVLATANDVTGFVHAVNARAGGLAGRLRIRGNRLVDVARGGAAIANAASGTIDARGNWWGISAGPGGGMLQGANVDASEPLRLVGIDAPSAVMVGGSGVLAVRLAGAADAVQEASSIGLVARFSSSAATVDPSSVQLRQGEARTVFTAGTTTGTTAHAAALDSERVTASTKVVPLGGEVDDTPAVPSVAEQRVPVVPYRARTRMIGRSYARSLTAGIKQWVWTNKHASVRTTYVISHYDARRLGLRPRTNRTHNPFVIARVRTRAIRGRRVVSAPINRRPAWAIRKFGQRLAVTQISVIRTRDGKVRHSYRRIVLPAMVR